MHFLSRALRFLFYGSLLFAPLATHAAKPLSTTQKQVRHVPFWRPEGSWYFRAPIASYDTGMKCLKNAWYPYLHLGRTGIGVAAHFGSVFNEDWRQYRFSARCSVVQAALNLALVNFELFGRHSMAALDAGAAVGEQYVSLCCYYWLCPEARLTLEIGAISTATGHNRKKNSPAVGLRLDWKAYELAFLYMNLKAAGGIRHPLELGLRLGS